MTVFLLYFMHQHSTSTVLCECTQFFYCTLCIVQYFYSPLCMYSVLLLYFMHVLSNSTVLYVWLWFLQYLMHSLSTSVLYVSAQYFYRNMWYMNPLFLQYFMVYVHSNSAVLSGIYTVFYATYTVIQQYFMVYVHSISTVHKGLYMLRETRG